MTTLLTFLAPIWFAYLIVRAIIIEVALSNMAKRNKDKQELGEKIQRRMDVLLRDNTRVIVDFFQTGEFDETSDKLLGEENRELEEMIKRYEQM